MLFFLVSACHEPRRFVERAKHDVCHSTTICKLNQNFLIVSRTIDVGFELQNIQLIA